MGLRVPFLRPSGTYYNWNKSICQLIDWMVWFRLVWETCRFLVTSTYLGTTSMVPSPPMATNSQHSRRGRYIYWETTVFVGHSSIDRVPVFQLILRQPCSKEHMLLEITPCWRFFSSDSKSGFASSYMLLALFHLDRTRRILMQSVSSNKIRCGSFKMPTWRHHDSQLMYI